MMADMDTLAPQAIGSGRPQVVGVLAQRAAVVAHEIDQFVIALLWSSVIAGALVLPMMSATK